MKEETTNKPQKGDIEGILEAHTKEILMRGSQGEAVKQLQEFLGIEVDGDFGQQTENAVIMFQKEKRILQTGKVGPITWGAILRNEELAAKYLSDQNIKDFSLEFGLEPALVRAVWEVEANGNGFFANGKPAILFEAHIFWGQLQLQGINPNEVYSGNENILSPSWNRALYIGGEAEYNRLEQAKAINETAALRSASWGAFQIMGFNHRFCGFDNVQDFVEAMHQNEAQQLKAFGMFIVNNNLLGHLRNKNWAGFALGYNGAGFAQNQYHIKLANAYFKYKPC